MYRIWLIALMVIPLTRSVPASGQTDKALTGIEESSAGINRMYSLINAANKLYPQSPKVALDSIEKALQLAYKFKDTDGQAYCFQTLAAIQFRIGSYRQALLYGEKALAIFRSSGLTRPYLITLRTAGESAEAMNDQERAIRYYKEWLDLDPEGDKTTVREKLGRVYFNTDKAELARDQFLQLLKIYTHNNSTDNVIRTYENLGKSLSKLGNTEGAIRYFQSADSMRAQYHPDYDSARYYENLSYSYNKSSNPKRKVEYQKKALEVNRKTDRKSDMFLNNLNIGQAYLESKEPGKALPYIRESINLAEQMGELESSGEAYLKLIEAYENSGQLRKARESFEKYKSIQENILEKKETEVTGFFEENLDLFEKDKRIALLVKEKELDDSRIELLEKEQNNQNRLLQRQRQINVFLVAVSLLMIVGIFLLIRGNRQRRIANKLLAIRSLRSQMNPHFIFNSLNSVNNFISQSDDRSANKFLTEFSRLMRMVLQNSRADFVTLESEIEILDRYLKLEHLRFGDHYDYTFTIDPEIEADQVNVPPMLFQPFIENAIWHGLRYLQEHGRLRVAIERLDNTIKIAVEDNGIGREKSAALKTVNQLKKKSQGIQNTMERIKLLNEIHHTGIRVEISDLHPGAENPGTRVEVWVPVRQVEPNPVET